MTDALEKLQLGADKVGRKLAAKGFREHTVKLVAVTTTGKDPKLGTKGTTTEVVTTFDPPPLVENVSMRMVELSAGRINIGDIVISGISRSSTYETLVKDVKTVWRITGPSFNGDYQMIDGQLKMKPTEWVVTLKRKAL